MKAVYLQDFRPDLNPLGYATSGVFESFYPNIGSLKTAIEDELYKMSKESILNTCK